MKHIILYLLFLSSVPIQAQQTIANLLHAGLQEADNGFSGFMKDTLHRNGSIVLKEDIVNSYQGVSRIVFSFKKDHKSVIMNNTLYTLNEMKIDARSILAGNKEWKELKDDFYKQFMGQVDYFTKTYAALLNATTVIIRSEDKENDFYPFFLVYFYHKGIQLPPGISDATEIEEKLDVAPYFSIALKKRWPTVNYYMEYRVHGATRQ